MAGWLFSSRRARQHARVIVVCRRTVGPLDAAMASSAGRTQRSGLGPIVQRRTLRIEFARHPPASAVQPRRDRRLRCIQDSRRLSVGEAGNVDRDQGQAEGLGQLGDRREHLPSDHRFLWTRACAGVSGVELPERRDRVGTARGPPPACQERVAQRSHQVRALIAAAERPRPRQDPGDRLLDEVLRALARVTQGRRGPQEGTEVRAQALGIKPLQASSGRVNPRPTTRGSLSSARIRAGRDAWCEVDVRHAGCAMTRIAGAIPGSL